MNPGNVVDAQFSIPYTTACALLRGDVFLADFEPERIGEAEIAEPVVLGHEFAATKEDGTRVAVDPAIPCETCEHCREGNPNLCENIIFAGYGKQEGALREYLSWPERTCFPIPGSGIMRSISIAAGIRRERCKPLNSEMF